MPRSSTPTPDPRESIILSKRPAFVDPREIDPAAKLWLPDYSPSFGLEEQPLESSDQIDTRTLRPCPPDAPAHASQPEVAKAASEIAKWTFDSYCTLVTHSLRIYNRYRKLVNAGEKDPLILGRYRTACRLAIEQILRRDLPRIKDWVWAYDFPLLPVFEVSLIYTVGSDGGADDEIVKGVSIRAVIEVRQAWGGDSSLFTMAMDGSPGSDGSDASSSSSSQSDGPP